MPDSTPFVIAHRGASGYLPEHTLEAKALAHGQGAEYLEQDLVLTRDNVPIVLHDVHLDTITDVAALFSGRARSDGRYYAIDFTLEEIRQLTVSERFQPKTRQAVFPDRFPPHTGRFHIPTLEEELDFIQGLNHSTGRTAGIYPEIKQPAFHRAEGRDISSIVVDLLKKHGYQTSDDLCFLQCFDREELRRIRTELHCELKLIQLLETKDLAEALQSPEKLTTLMQELAREVYGIGPNLMSVFPDQTVTETTQSLLVSTAHAHKLEVHPWTCRADSLPSNFQSFAELHQALFRVGIDGVFSDFPDQSRQLFLNCRTEQ